MSLDGQVECASYELWRWKTSVEYDVVYLCLIRGAVEVTDDTPQ
jgi:hypothetical protein